LIIVSLYVSISLSVCLSVCVYQEVDYEWGGVGTEAYVSSLPEPLAKLARASKRWRIDLSEACQVSGAWDRGCFHLGFPHLS